MNLVGHRQLACSRNTPQYLGLESNIGRGVTTPPHAARISEQLQEYQKPYLPSNGGVTTHSGAMAIPGQLQKDL